MASTLYSHYDVADGSRGVCLFQQHVNYYHPGATTTCFRGGYRLDLRCWWDRCSPGFDPGSPPGTPFDSRTFHPVNTLVYRFELALVCACSLSFGIRRS